MAATVIIDLPAQQGNADEIKTFIRSIVADTRSFEGFENLTMHESQDNPGHLVLQERWESRQHHEKYLAWRTARGDLAKVQSMLSAAPSIRYFDDIEL